MKPHTLLAGALILCLTCSAYALSFVHPIFTNNMVLQRGVPAPIWGWTTPGASITVNIAATNYTTTADAVTGRWQVNAGPFIAGGPWTLTVTGPQTATFTNVMVGEVWLCSGQSNMAYTINNMGGNPVINSAAEIADSVNYPNVRVFTTPQPDADGALTPQLEPKSGGSWTVPSTTTTGNFTATGYFFARELSKRLGNVAIGIVCSAQGGTQIKTWTDPLATGTFADFAPTLAAEGSGVTISNLYNGLIAPLSPFAFKGVCYYQGEFDRGTPQQFARLFPQLRNGWRSIFPATPLPFIVIQLPTWGNGINNMDTTGWADIREAQEKVATMPGANSVVVSTIDLGDGDLHPKNKQDIGYRAARAAANLAYGQDVVGQGPIFAYATNEGGSLRCYFTNIGDGLMFGTKNAAIPLSPVQQSSGVLGGFYVAGANGVFAAATATIDALTNTVVVSSASVATPLYVRYSWAAKLPCNLYNKITDENGNVVDGMPASSFRNDPFYKLTVTSGTGSATYSPSAPAPVTITAAAAPSGKVFDRWTGDTGILANPFSATTTATPTPGYTDVAANYRPIGSTLFAPWASRDIGAVGLAGSANMNAEANSFTLTAAGNDVGISPDAFHFAYVPLIGDGSLVARVDSQQASGNNPRAGVMMRASLAADAPYAFTYVTPTECRYQGRWVTGAASGTSGSAGAHKWVKVTRTGNQYRGYSSIDGVTWSQVGSTVTFAASGPIYVGLAACSRNVSVTNTATFGGVTGYSGFRDRFEDGTANGWTTYGGAWSVTGSAYTVAANNGAKAVAKNFLSSNFTYDADVAFSGGEAGLVFRVNNPAVGADAYKGYYAGISATGITLVRVNNGVSVAIGNYPTPLAEGVMHHLRVQAVGSSLKIFLTDMVTPKISVADTTYAFGSLGVRTLNANASFDNLTVLK